MLKPDPVALAPTIIEPAKRWPTLGLGEAWRYRSICLVLARRSLKVRYRQTVLGIAWALIQPLALMLIFTIFFGLLGRVASEGVPYPIFFFTALAIWQVASKIMSEGSGSVVAGGALISRVYFPRIYFPASVALASLVDLSFNLVVVGIMMVWYGMLPDATILSVPFLIAIAYVTSFGLALLLSGMSVEYRDVAVLVPLLIQMWFFATPIIYSASIVPAAYAWLYYLNPMALVVTGMRSALLGSPAPPFEAWPLAVGVSVVLLLAGYLVFRKREAAFADLV